MGTAQFVAPPRTLSGAEVDQLDPYAFFAVLGKRVIHPGGRAATDELIRRAEFRADQHVLDVGCVVLAPRRYASPRVLAPASPRSTLRRSCSSAQRATSTVRVVAIGSQWSMAISATSVSQMKASIAW